MEKGNRIKSKESWIDLFAKTESILKLYKLKTLYIQRGDTLIEEAFLSKDDEELLRFIESSAPKICVVGTGGGGCNTLNRMFEMGIQGASIIAMNTDAHHLVKTRADKKLLLGKNTTKGLGAGSNPAVGEEAAKESKNDIEKILSDSQMVFVTCGLGGGTGTGSAHIIAEEAKDHGALTVAVVTLPFLSEG